MLTSPEIVQTSPQLCAKLHIVVPRARIREVMWPGREELLAAVAAQSVTITGPWFTHHLRIDDENFDFEICVPVASPVTPAGRVQPGEWPALTMAQTIYQGGYEGLGEAWGEFDDWIVAQGHTPAEDLYEVYLTGVEAGADSSLYRTQLNRGFADSPG